MQRESTSIPGPTTYAKSTRPHFHARPQSTIVVAEDVRRQESINWVVRQLVLTGIIPCR